MLTVKRGDVLCTYCLVANGLRSCPVIIDDEQFSLFVHATLAVLSQCIPMCACWRCIGEMCSKTSHAKSSPASSRSLMVIVPFGFSCDTRFLDISCGHLHLHTIGCGRCLVPSIHTPPTPFLEASV